MAYDLGNTEDIIWENEPIALKDAPVAVPTTMKYLITRQKMVTPYLHGDGFGDPNLTCTDVYSLFDVSCIKISETLYNTFRPEWTGKFIEIDERTAFYGAALFSEIRPQGKIYEAENDSYAKVKKPIDLTPEIIAYVRDFMYKFAKMILEVEFDDRYHELADTSVLERNSWEIQKHEAREYLNDKTGSVTPFLDYIAQEHGVTKDVLANKILSKAEEYEDNLSTLLVKFQKIIKEFKNAETIWDLNILYEKYFGILMPERQAIELGLTVSETDWTRKVPVKVNAFGF